MDRTQAIGAGGLAAVGLPILYAQTKQHQALLMGASGDALVAATDDAVAVDDRYRAHLSSAHPGSAHPFDPATYTHLADDIDGVPDNPAAARLNELKRPASSPLRIASGMNLHDGVDYLQASARKAYAFEGLALKGARTGFKAAGIVAVIAGAATVTSIAADHNWFTSR